MFPCILQYIDAGGTSDPEVRAAAGAGQHATLPHKHRVLHAVEPNATLSGYFWMRSGLIAKVSCHTKDMMTMSTNCVVMNAAQHTAGHLDLRLSRAASTAFSGDVRRMVTPRLPK